MPHIIDEINDGYSNVVDTFITYYLTLKNEMDDQYEVRKEEIFSKWEESKKLPRKAKKKLRKKLNLKFSILEYGKELFNFGIK